jgi:hypothetical protein
MSTTLFFERVRGSGALVISCYINDAYLVSHTYYGYSKREATRLFREYLRVTP